MRNTGRDIFSIACCRYTWQNWSILSKTGLMLKLRTTSDKRAQLWQGHTELKYSIFSRFYADYRRKWRSSKWRETKDKWNSLCKALSLCHRQNTAGIHVTGNSKKIQSSDSSARDTTSPRVYLNVRPEGSSMRMQSAVPLCNGDMTIHHSERSIIFSVIQHDWRLSC